MKILKVLCTGLVSLSLTFSLFPISPAFAVDSSDNSSVGPAVSTSADAPTPTQQDGEDQTSSTNETQQDSPRAAAEATTQEQSATRVRASDVISFLYRENEVISAEETENIVIGFLDESRSISSAELIITDNANDSERSFDVSKTAPGALLFTLSFPNDVSLGKYTISKLYFRYSDTGALSVVNFSADEQDLNSQGIELESSSREFEIVSSQTKQLYDQDSTSDNNISAYAVDDSGNFVEADSVSDAINIADKDKDSKGRAGDSTDTGANAVDNLSPEAMDAEGAYSEPPAEQSSSDEYSLADGAETPDDSTTPINEGEKAESLLSIISQPFITWIKDLFNSGKADAAVADSRENYLIVAINAGHGGYDDGATGNGLKEKDINLSIAKSMYNELLTYSGVTPYLIREDDTNHDRDNGYTSMQWRVDKASAIGADVYISIHVNSGGGSGSEVWVPNDSSYNYSSHTIGQELGTEIITKLSQLGLKNRGVKTRDSENGTKYSDGSLADYYGDIRCSREAGIPGIIVEHAFIDSDSDAALLANKQQELGMADATGVAQQYHLLKDSVSQSNSLVQAKAHSSNIGWESAVYDNKVAGTTGKAFGLEAIQLRLQNDAAASGGIQYRAYVGDAWQSWVGNGETAGTTGQSTPLQAMQIRLTGEAANKYDVYYRVHSSNIGWLGWASNGSTAGTINYNSCSAEAIEVVLVSKGASAPGSTSKSSITNLKNSVAYNAHVQDIGWQDYVRNGDTAGTTGRALRVEALHIKLDNPGYSGNIVYRAHVQDIGWQEWVSNGAMAGTSGRCLRLEAIQINLTDEIAQHYDVYYRVHAEEIGWMGWAKNGESAGTQGYGYRLEAVQVQLVPKGGDAPGETSDAFRSNSNSVAYNAHVQDIGWQDYVRNGDTAGTTGRALRVEALHIKLDNPGYSGNIVYRAHVQDIGWQEWVSNGAMAGTSGRCLRLEAVQIKLDGEFEKHYDVYYRVHAEEIGWMGWAKNGESAGTQGYGYRLEAVQVQLVPKGGDAPGETSDAFRNENVTLQTSDSIMGTSQSTAAQMARYYKSKVGSSTYPSSVFSSKGASSIDDFCQIVSEEASAEGVRAEVVFAQAMWETGWLKFGGDVSAEQCNFAGLGATGGGSSGATFTSVREGIRAQVQHLKAYASTDELNNPCVDPRFNLVTRGSATSVTDLNGKWAVPGTGYGESILALMDECLNA